MKTRNGFVSNSSSCSFLIYGICLNIEKATELTKKLGMGGLDEFPEGSDVFSYYKSLIKDNAVDLDVESPSEYTGIYIGKSWSKVKDGETGKEFKARTEADILKVLNGEYPDVKFATYTHAWYDG